VTLRLTLRVEGIVDDASQRATYVMDGVAWATMNSAARRYFIEERINELFLMARAVTSEAGIAQTKGSLP